MLEEFIILVLDSQNKIVGEKIVDDFPENKEILDLVKITPNGCAAMVHKYYDCR